MCNHPPTHRGYGGYILVTTETTKWRHTTFYSRKHNNNDCSASRTFIFILCICLKFIRYIFCPCVFRVFGGIMFLPFIRLRGMWQMYMFWYCVSLNRPFICTYTHEGYHLRDKIKRINEKTFKKCITFSLKIYFFLNL